MAEAVAEDAAKADEIERQTRYYRDYCSSTLQACFRLYSNRHRAKTLTSSDLAFRDRARSQCKQGVDILEPVSL